MMPGLSRALRPAPFSARAVLVSVVCVGALGNGIELYAEERACVAEPSLSLSLQIPLFLKAMSFDRRFESAERPSVSVGVVYAGEQECSTDAMRQVIEVQRGLTRLRVKGRNVRFVPVELAELRSQREDPQSQSFDALYVTPMNPSLVEEVAEIGTSRGILTLAAVSEDVARGIVIGLELHSGKPRLLVNLPVARENGTRFSASFLHLCRIVDRAE